MLEVKNISVSYGHVDALHNVNIQVPTGKIVSVIGANGAGKTSLVNTISGLVKPTTGEIVFNGEVLPKASHKIVGKGVVQVPEGRKVFAGLSVQENLIMGSSKLKKPFKEKEAEIYEMFPILGQRKSQQAGTLSGGEQQMLAIGRALMSEPEFIMLDEPSMGLAPVIVKQVFRIIKQINAAGTTILLIEQNARQALGISDYTYVLENGHITLEGPSAQLLADPAVQKAYLGD
ncbi:MAG: ABC transporter ATP-binding protein [Clostridiales bacterium]|nr:ABC transporter ATP-binding protein [Clostridiales bacterium]